MLQFQHGCSEFYSVVLSFRGQRLFPSVYRAVLDLIPFVATLLPGEIGNMHKIYRICIKSIMSGLGILLSLTALMGKLLERSQPSPGAILPVSGARLGSWRELVWLVFP